MYMHVLTSKSLGTQLPNTTVSATVRRIWVHVHRTTPNAVVFLQLLYSTCINQLYIYCLILELINQINSICVELNESWPRLTVSNLIPTMSAICSRRWKIYRVLLGHCLWYPSLFSTAHIHVGLNVIFMISTSM